jgi:hypothetical protein
MSVKTEEPQLAFIEVGDEGAQVRRHRLSRCLIGSVGDVIVDLDGRQQQELHEMGVVRKTGG